MPWQSELFDVALEVDDRGALWYRTVVVVVPRQQGKSAAMGAVMVERALMGRDRTVAYTAQDRSIAAERVVEQLFVRQLARSARSAPPPRCGARTGPSASSSATGRASS